MFNRNPLKTITQSKLEPMGISIDETKQNTLLWWAKQDTDLRWEITLSPKLHFAPLPTEENKHHKCLFRLWLPYF